MSDAGPRKRSLKPLNSARLEELAVAYVARMAVSRAKLEAYLRRKLRERPWDGEDEPDIGGIARRFVAAGYVDDAAYARAKSDSLLRRGYGQRRISQALDAAGVDEVDRAGLRRASEERRAALVMARKRRFGPFGPQPLDRKLREKQLAAMLRAGHALANARAVIDAPDSAAAEEWADEAAAGADEEQG